MRKITRMSVRRGFRTRPHVSNGHVCLKRGSTIPGTALFTLRNAMWVVDKKDVRKVFFGDKFFEFRWETLVAWDRLIRNVKPRIVLHGFRAHTVRETLFEVYAGYRNEALLLFGYVVTHPHKSNFEIIAHFAHSMYHRPRFVSAFTPFVTAKTECFQFSFVVRNAS